MSGSVIFSEIDLTDGFYQILMSESDIPLTAVSTPSGMLWEWLVMPQAVDANEATVPGGVLPSGEAGDELVSETTRDATVVQDDTEVVQDSDTGVTVSAVGATVTSEAVVNNDTHEANSENELAAVADASATDEAWRALALGGGLDGDTVKRRGDVAKERAVLKQAKKDAKCQRVVPNNV
ncbi:unnamed protein product [Phytophthora fragariaefolia]|uniref:Unnamed protein product n=1 Tax=Phytophthora fragariaefolia TaxID=1490495 RepID=A0A9W7CUT9_9STRA|nr:unnamed protein product [Phytophthora fragariaefolia]